MCGGAVEKCELIVRSAKREDVYRDIVRISEQSRGSLKNGRVHRFHTASGSGYFILRGLGSTNDGLIRMDEASRASMGLPFGQKYEFTIAEAGFWGELLWAYSATDPAYRIAAKLGVLSFVLAVIAFVPIASEWLKFCLSFLRWTFEVSVPLISNVLYRLFP